MGGKPEEYNAKDGPVDCVAQLMTACGVKRAIIFGYDWGGGVACAFALRYPNRTRKLIPWCASVREPKSLEKWQPRGKQGDVLVLWAKNDAFHDYKKGRQIAEALGVKVVDVRLRKDGGEADVLPKVLELLAA